MSTTTIPSTTGGIEFAKNAILLIGGTILGGLLVNGNSAKAEDKERDDRTPRREDAKERDRETRVPGEHLPLRKRAEALVTSAIQPFGPIRNIAYHLIGFVWYGNQPNRQLEVHSFVAPLNNDVCQHTLYDGSDSNARLVGVCYTVSDRVYRTFPPEEQVLWSPNAYEVTSGLVVAPRLPKVAEKPILSDLVNTYSKTVMTWHVDRDPLPVGIPQFAYKFTGDGQIDERLLRRRDVKHGLNTNDLKQSRKDLEPPEVKPAYDQWRMKKQPQLKLET